jgi:hypothetical protein
MTVYPSQSVSVTVYVSPSPQYPYSVSLSASSGSLSRASGYPPFASTWTITAPYSPGTYTYTVTGRGGDGKVRSATFTLTVSQSSYYYQGYVEVTNHYYVVEDVRAEARFASPVDWKLDHKDSRVKEMKGAARMFGVLLISSPSETSL